MKQREPSAGEVCVIEAGVDELLASLDGSSLLSAEEAARADRFRLPQARRRFVAARALARVKLAEALGADPRELRIKIAANGKPELAEAASLRFSLAHSGGRVMLAFCAEHEVGADLEELRGLSELLEVARRFFAPDEHAALAALPENERVPAFFSRWTRKEACLKALGQGISGGLERSEFTPFTARSVPSAPGYAAAVAAAGSDWSVRCERWRGPEARLGA